VTVAAGDLNGDTRAEMITGASDGGSSHVKVFGQDLGLQRSFYAFDSITRGGVFVAAGDLNGDGRAEILAGNGQTAAEVKVFSFDAESGVARESVISQDPEIFRHGVRVGVVDRFADARLDILTGSGPTTSPVVQVFDGRTLDRLDSFLAYEAGMTGGVFVG
jgi:hypothetical protein